MSTRLIGFSAKRTSALAVALSALVSFATTNMARAEFVYTVTEFENNVLVQGSGTLDLDGLIYYDSETAPVVFISADFGILTGGVSSVAGMWGGVYGPDSIGHIGGGYSLHFDGPMVQIDGSHGRLKVDSNYVSDTYLSNFATYMGYSFASLGLVVGTYVYTWGEGEDADSLTINVVPEPATFGMVVMGGGALFLRRRRR